MRFFALFLAIISCVGLSSCASHMKDYLKKDQQMSPIVVPPGVPALKQQTYYPVPSTTQSQARKSVSLIPPTLSSSSR